MNRDTRATGAAATGALPLRLAAWPASHGALLAGEGAAPAYTAAPAAAHGPDSMVGSDAVEALLQGMDGNALLDVADRVVSRLADEPLTAHEAVLADSVAALHRLGRRMNAEWHRRVAELDERDAWQALRCRSTSDWLTSTLALTSYEARAAVEVARVLRELPETAAQFAAGEIDVAAVQAAARAHAELARLEARAAAEREATAHDGDGSRDGDAQSTAPDGAETRSPDADERGGRGAGGAGRKRSIGRGRSWTG